MSALSGRREEVREQREADQGVGLWRRGRVPGGDGQARQIRRLREPLQVRVMEVQLE